MYCIIGSFKFATDNVPTIKDRIIIEGSIFKLFERTNPFAKIQIVGEDVTDFIFQTFVSTEFQRLDLVFKSNDCPVNLQ